MGRWGKSSNTPTLQRPITQNDAAYHVYNKANRYFSHTLLNKYTRHWDMGTESYTIGTPATMIILRRLAKRLLTGFVDGDIYVGNGGLEGMQKRLKIEE